MTTDLDDRVRDALAYRADRTTITAATTFDGRPVAVVETRPLGPVVAAAAALVVAVVGVGALAITRSTSSDRAAEPTPLDSGPLPTTPGMTNVVTVPTVVAAVTEPAPPEASDAPLVHVPNDSPYVIGDAAPSETCLGCYFDPEAAYGPASWRVYALAGDRPDSGPAIVTVGQEDIVDTPGPYGAPVEVRGVTGHFSDLPGGGRMLSFFVGGYLYQLTGYRLPDAQLVVIAEEAEPGPDGVGVVLEPATLPDGVALRFEGWNDTVFLARGASTRASFHDLDSGTSAWFLSIPGLETAHLSRLGFDTVTDVEVGIISGYVGTFDDPGTVRTVVWPNGARTMVLWSSDLTADELVALAGSLEFG